MDELFERVREEASRSAWSRGVELARAGAVSTQRVEGSELVVRVRPTGGVVHPSVLLYVDDAEWECDCGGADDPCEHVAAAVIAVRRARREGEELPPPTGEIGGRLSYRLRSTPEGLELDRVVCHAGGETLLRGTLTAVAQGRIDGPPLSPGQVDQAVERALGPNLAGTLPRGVLRALLEPLSRCEDVQLDGVPIRVDAAPLRPRARVADAGSGFQVFVERECPVERELADGFVLAEGALRELAPSRLSGREQESLRAGWRFAPDDVAVLVGEVIPSLESRMGVVVETGRLPRGRREPPRIRIETAREGDRLSALATLVYGDPPLARVDAGRLTHLRGPVPQRDEAAEERLLRRLQAELGLVPGRRVELGAGDAIDWVARLAAFPADLAGDAHRAFARRGALEPELSLEGERLHVAFRGEAGIAADPEAVLRAWRAGESLVALSGGGFGELPADWLARHGARLADLLAARRPDGRLPAHALPDLARLWEALERPAPPAFAALAALVGDFHGLPAPALPPDLRAELRAYQREGVAWLQFLRRAGLGGLLADDMGLGKTLQALCSVGAPALVVAPTSLLGNWREELERFRPALRASVYHGGGRAFDPEADVTLTSYAILRLDREALAAREWDTLVLDEAQAIKNPESQVAAAAFALPARHRITLTGTPVENRLEELWSQLHFLNPGLLGGRSDFDERYARPIAAGDPEPAARLRERIRPFVLRRRKDEVAPELPPRTEQVLHCTLSPEERALYDALRAAARADVVAKLAEGGSVLAALEALLRLRQACCHPALVPGSGAAEDASSAKLDLLLDRLDTAVAEGHRSLVFSQWTALLDRVEPQLARAGLDFVRLDGSTRDRSEVVARFQSPSGPPVFLISLRAGGTGLNLTAADHVFLLDPWWNPAVEQQAADRAHRIGQERPVLVYRMVAEDTVEERILALQERKRGLADAALGSGGEAPGLDRDDLLALLA